MAHAWEKILLPIDFSASSEATLEAATGLAVRFRARVHLVHIIPQIPDLNGSDFFPKTAVLQDRPATMEQKLDTCKQQLERQGISTAVSIETSNDIVGNLMPVLKREEADLIVISTHGLTGWRQVILGSIAEQVIKLANCTLLLLHSIPRPDAPKEPAIDTWQDTFVPIVNESKNVKSPGPKPQNSSQQRMTYSAEELAEQGQRKEQHHDVNHSIFSK